MFDSGFRVWDTVLLRIPDDTGTSEDVATRGANFLKIITVLKTIRRKTDSILA